MSEKRDPRLLKVACPGCGRPAGKPCSDDVAKDTVHKWRRQAAIEAGVIPADPAKAKCACRNHMGGPKIQHRTQAAALAWILRSRSDGMRYEPYKCPTADRWHVRTARTPRRP